MHAYNLSVLENPAIKVNCDTLSTHRPTLYSVPVSLHSKNMRSALASSFFTLSRSEQMDNIINEYAREFLELTIRLCHSMGLPVCVNGIETKEQYDYCKNNGCDRMQGYYLHTANNAAALNGLL